MADWGKYADLLVVDGDPLKNLRVFQNTALLLAIVKGGVFVKRTLYPLDGRETAWQAPPTPSGYFNLGPHPTAPQQLKQIRKDLKMNSPRKACPKTMN